MKPLTKTVVSRGGGIAARFAPAQTVADAKTTTTDTVRVTLKELAKQRKRGLLNDTVANSVANPVANVANKPRYAKWREANPELWLERQRGYQAKHRKRRAKERDEWEEIKQIALEQVFAEDERAKEQK